jgi:hypothetical protein
VKKAIKKPEITPTTIEAIMPQALSCIIVVPPSRDASKFATKSVSGIEARIAMPPAR